jgi:hypothetical protein
MYLARGLVQISPILSGTLSACTWVWCAWCDTNLLTWSWSWPSIVDSRLEQKKAFLSDFWAKSSATLLAPKPTKHICQNTLSNMLFHIMHSDKTSDLLSATMFLFESNQSTQVPTLCNLSRWVLWLLNGVNVLFYVVFWKWDYCSIMCKMLLK